MDVQALNQKTRDELIAQARALGVERAELMTRVELRDEILRRSERDPAKLKRARGLLGVARDLLASMVESGLHLPDAAALIRGDARTELVRKGPAPVATVTLAEIYAAQGHLSRSLQMLDQVLAREPEHQAARTLRTRLLLERTAGLGAPVETHLSASSPEQSREPGREIHTNGHEARTNGQPAPGASAPTESFSARAAFQEFLNRPDGSIEPDEFPSLDDEFPSSVDLEMPAMALDSDLEEVLPDYEDSLLPPSTTRSGIDSLLGSSAARSPLPPSTPDIPRESGVVGIRQADQSYVYWEVARGAWDFLRARAPNGQAVIKLRGFRPTARGVEPFEQEIRADDAAAGRWIPGVDRKVTLRVALGWQEQARFWPVCVGSELVVGERGDIEGRFRPRSSLVAPIQSFEERALRSYRAARALR